MQQHNRNRRRSLITVEEEHDATEDIHDALTRQFAKKGRHSCASIHEALGVIDEEHSELKEAVHLNDHNKVLEELKDIAVACAWAIASIKAKKVDW